MESSTLRRYARAGSLKIQRVAGVLTWPEKWRFAFAPHDLRLPDFLLIGAPRSGTTWLHRQFKAHPEIFTPPRRKELHYFDNHFARPVRAYAKNFQQAGTRLAGESTPNYLYLSIPRLRLIRRLMPDVRLLVLLRNPVDRAWSEAVFRKVTRASDKTYDCLADELADYATSATNLTRGRYSHWLDRWLSVFPSDQLYVGVFDEIIDSPTQLLTQVAHHLAISPDKWDPSLMAAVANPNRELACPQDLRVWLEDFYREEKSELVARFGDRVANWSSGFEDDSGSAQ